MKAAFLIAFALAGSALVAGCQSSPPSSTSSTWRFPCGYRAFDAGRCDKLGGLPNTDFNLSARLLGQ
jgi:hypothetical protein